MSSLKTYEIQLLSMKWWSVVLRLLSSQKNGYDRFICIKSSDFNRLDQVDARARLLERIIISEHKRAEGLGTDAFEATNNLRQNTTYSIIVQPTAQRERQNIHCSSISSTQDYASLVMRGIQRITQGHNRKS